MVKSILILLMISLISCTSTSGEKAIPLILHNIESIEKLPEKFYDNLDSVRYLSAFEYIMNSTELDDFYNRYHVTKHEKTFCIKKEVSKIRAEDSDRILEYQYNLDLPERPWSEESIYPDKERYLKLKDSLRTINLEPREYIDTIDFSYILEDDYDCNFIVEFTNIEENRLQVNIRFGIIWENLDSKERNFNSTGLKFTFFFKPESSTVEKAFGANWIT